MCLLSPVSSAHRSPAEAPPGRLLQPHSYHHAEGNCQRRDSCPSADGSTASEALEEVERQLASRTFTGALLPWAEHCVRAMRDVTLMQVAPGWQKDVKSPKKPMRKKKKGELLGYSCLAHTENRPKRHGACLGACSRKPFF